MTSTSAERVWLTPEAYDRLQAELAELASTGAFSDADQDDHAATRLRRQARIREIQDLLITAVVGQDPPDDGIAEPGMVLTVRYDDTGDTETFLLGVRAAEHGAMEVYSPDSPLGAALTGARQGERRSYRVPSGDTVRVTLLDAVPYGNATPSPARNASAPVRLGRPSART